MTTVVHGIAIAQANDRILRSSQREQIIFNRYYLKGEEISFP